MSLENTSKMQSIQGIKELVKKKNTNKRSLSMNEDLFDKRKMKDLRVEIKEKHF